MCLFHVNFFLWMPCSFLNIVDLSASTYDTCIFDSLISLTPDPNGFPLSREMQIGKNTISWFAISLRGEIYHNKAGVCVLIFTVRVGN